MTRAQLIAPTPADRWPHPPKPPPFGWKFWRPPPPRPPRPSGKYKSRAKPKPVLIVHEVAPLPPGCFGVTHRQIVEKGAEMFGLPVEYLIHGPKSDRNRIRARRVVVALLRAHVLCGTRLSYPGIAELMGGRKSSHSTAQHMLVAWAHDAALVGLAIQLADRLGLGYAAELGDLAAWAQHHRTHRFPGYDSRAGPR